MSSQKCPHIDSRMSILVVNIQKAQGHVRVCTHLRCHPLLRSNCTGKRREVASRATLIRFQRPDEITHPRRCGIWPKSGSFHYYFLQHVSWQICANRGWQHMTITSYRAVKRHYLNVKQLKQHVDLDASGFSWHSLCAMLSISPSLHFWCHVQ